MGRMSTISIIAYAEAAVWIDHKVAPVLVQRLAEGRYGFKPEFAYINAQNVAKQLSKALPTILKRVAAYNIDYLTLSTWGTYDPNLDYPPYADLSLSDDRENDCHLSLTLPVALEQISHDEVNHLIQITERVIEDSRAQYACVHESADWEQLHDERDGDLLFLRSCSRGAYWLTYFCDEYVGRLEGEKKLKAAPAWQVRELPNGILLISHPDPKDFDKEPKKSDIHKLHEYLQSLVKPEDKP